MSKRARTLRTQLAGGAADTRRMNDNVSVTVEQKIAVFENRVALPALEEVARAPALLATFAASVIVDRPAEDGPAEELLGALGAALRRREGPSLVLTERAPPPSRSPLAGRYALTVFYEVRGEEVFASPGVAYWMAFNQRLHLFAHRFDVAIAQHPVEQVTRRHLHGHVLDSLFFYRQHAHAPTPFPGYR